MNRRGGAQPCNALVRLRFLAALATFAALGCGEEGYWPVRPDVDRLAVVVAPRRVGPGARAQVSAVAFRGAAAIPAGRVRIAFASSDAAVARVDVETGAVVAVAPGKAVVYATAQGRQGSDTIQVVARP